MQGCNGPIVIQCPQKIWDHGVKVNFNAETVLVEIGKAAAKSYSIAYKAYLDEPSKENKKRLRAEERFIRNGILCDLNIDADAFLRRLERQVENATKKNRTSK